MADMPIACTLSPDALRARRDGLLAELVQRAGRHEPTGEGLCVYLFPDADILGKLARIVDTERCCCRFPWFVIAVEPDGGPLSLELSDPAGTRDFIAGLLNL